MGTNGNESAENDRGKGARQALYLAYRSITVNEAGGHMTQAAAAKLAGVASKTVSRWKAENEQFRVQDREASRYGAGQARKLAKAAVSALLPEAVTQLVGLLVDEDTPPSVKAQVALALMKYAGAEEPTEIEVSGDPWGALLRKLAEDEQDE